MNLKSLRGKWTSLEIIRDVIRELEAPQSPINKFKNTAIYDSLQHNKRVLEANPYKEI